MTWGRRQGDGGGQRVRAAWGPRAHHSRSAVAQAVVGLELTWNSGWPWVKEGRAFGAVGVLQKGGLQVFVIVMDCMFVSPKILC